MCGRFDFGQRRRTLERLSAETNVAWEHACSYALLGRSIKNGPIAGQPPLFNPIKLTVRRRPTGSRNFSRPSTLTRFSAYRIARRASGRQSASRYKLVGRASRGPGAGGDPRAAARVRYRYRLGNLLDAHVLSAARLSHEGGKLQSGVNMSAAPICVVRVARAQGSSSGGFSPPLIILISPLRLR